MKYDLHMHTTRSSCAALKPRDILKIAHRKKLDGIAITDHNTIKGGERVYKLNKNKDFEVIVGSEMKTQHGELLIYYQNEEIKTRDLFEVIDSAKQQGAIIGIAHPFRLVPWLRFKYPINKLRKIVDAVECFNSRNFILSNIKAKNVAKREGFACIGGSDAHWKFDIGNGYTTFEGNLIKAIKTRKTNVGGTTIMAGLSGVMSTFKKRVLSRKS